MSDEEIWKLRRGGHDPVKVYNAYKRAVEHQGSADVILAKTVKGYGLGEAGEGRKITHQQKKLNENEIAHFRDALRDSDFRRGGAQRRLLPPAGGQPGDDVSARARGGSWAATCRRAIRRSRSHRRRRRSKYFKESLDGSRGREVSTTMAFVRVLHAADEASGAGQARRADHSR